MGYTTPAIADFKSYFTRDFPYGSDPSIAVLDSDIQKAFDLASVNLNENLFSSQSEFSIGFYYLSAHFLVTTLRASSQGISGQYSWMQTSKSVGSVSGGYQIPQRIMDNPELAVYSQTNYGVQYLQMIIPKLSGQIFSVGGGTQP